jgi:pimeloyl-ACP methyl ester carboxylesterase
MIRPEGVAMPEPETRYARSGGVHIAYQVIGEGPLDLVFVPGFMSHLEFQWEEPRQARFFRRLARFARLIRFDKRGAGLSDRVKTGDLDERMDDIRAVMDATGSERAALLGLSEGGPLALGFAATYPERTAALALWNAFARLRWAPDYPWGGTPEVADQVIGAFGTHWGTGALLSLFTPSLASDESFRDWWTRCERLAMSPGAALDGMRWVTDIDARHILPIIGVPTLVLHASADTAIPVDHGRYIAEHIGNARYVELPSEDHFSWSSADIVAEEVEEFLTGARTTDEPERVLATVLFTDIVDSTKLASRLGDRAWCDLLERHHAFVRKELARFRGREIDTAGDGFLATFDGPARAVRCACSIRDEVRRLGIEIRSGLHAGEVELTGGTLSGIAVHIAARVSETAGANEVLVSSTIKDLVVGSGLQFADRGPRVLKGIPDEWRLFLVE